MITRIHVNQHHIKANAKGANLPVLTVKTSKKGYLSNIKTNRVIIYGPSEVVYSPDKPLSCGAKVWIETHADLSIEEFVE
jgi:hypothetical protein